MAITLGTPTLVGSQATTNFSAAYTALGGGRGVVVIASQRGGNPGTSPSALTFGGVDLLDPLNADPYHGPAAGLAEITGSARAHRAYWLPANLHPGSGSRTVACTWAAVDNIAVSVIEVLADGELSIADSDQLSNQGSPLNLGITAGAGDVTITVCQGNSASPNFQPQSGQSEFLESAWYTNTGHVVGIQTGAQTATNWTAAGSTCISAFVLHETLADEIEGEAETIGGGSTSGSGSPQVTATCSSVGGGSTSSAGSSVFVGAVSSVGGGSSSAEGAPRFVAVLSSLGGGSTSSAGSPTVTGEGSSIGGGVSRAFDSLPIVFGAVSSVGGGSTSSEGSSVCRGTVATIGGGATSCAGSPSIGGALSSSGGGASSGSGTPTAAGMLSTWGGGFSFATDRVSARKVPIRGTLTRGGRTRGALRPGGRLVGRRT